MSKHSDKVYALHIIESIDDIERYIIKGLDNFLEDDIIQNAVLRKLQVMAESTTKLNDKWKSSIPEVNWRALAGFRNILVHDYLGGVDLFIIWEHVSKDLPILKNAISKMLLDIKEY